MNFLFVTTLTFILIFTIIEIKFKPRFGIMNLEKSDYLVLWYSIKSKVHEDMTFRYFVKLFNLKN